MVLVVVVVGHACDQEGPVQGARPPLEASLPEEDGRARLGSWLRSRIIYILAGPVALRAPPPPAAIVLAARTRAGLHAAGPWVF